MEFIIVKQMEVREHMKKYLDMASEGTNILIPRKNNKNVVVISEEEWKEYERLKTNFAYLQKLERSRLEHERKEIITKTMQELEAMADE